MEQSSLEKFVHLEVAQAKGRLARASTFQKIDERTSMCDTLGFTSSSYGSAPIHKTTVVRADFISLHDSKW